MSIFKKGEIILGSVTGIEPYGIFVNLDEYYNGLIHISEVSDGFVKDLNDYVKVGEKIRVKVLNIKEEEHQVDLSIKNINYKIKTIRRKKLKEKGEGFKPLKEMLPIWVEEKLSKIKSGNIDK